MPDEGKNRDGIFIDEAVHHIYKELTDGNDPEASPFKTMKDVFMWSASLGYKIGERRPLTSRTMVFRWAQLSEQIDVPLVKAIAIADKEELGVLSSQGDVLDIVEEYANAGVHELRSSVLDEYGQPLWNLSAMIEQL